MGKRKKKIWRKLAKLWKIVIISPNIHLPEILQTSLFLSNTGYLLLTAVTGSECAGRVFKHFPVFTSQIRTLSSNCKNKQKSILAWNHLFWPCLNSMHKFLKMLLSTTFYRLKTMLLKLDFYVHPSHFFLFLKKANLLNK